MKYALLILVAATGLGCSSPAPDHVCWKDKAGGGGTPKSANPKTLATLDWIDSSAQDATHIYISGTPDRPDGVSGRSYWLSRVPKTGGPLQKLVELSDKAITMAVDADSVYLVFYYGNPIMKVSKQGSSPIEVYQPGESRVDEVLVDGDQLFWIERDRNAVTAGGIAYRLRSQPRAGGKPRTLATFKGQIANLVSHGGAFYVTSETPKGLLSVPREGGAATVVLEGLQGRFVLENKRVWWTQDAVLSAEFGSRKRTWVSSIYHSDGWVRADGSHLYWSDGTRLFRQAHSGGPKEFLAEEPEASPGVTDFGLDAQGVYWATYHSVRHVPRP